MVIASNYGQRHHPSWYSNLRANPKATHSVGGAQQQVVARKMEGEERDRLWWLGLTGYPGWFGFERRAGWRRIPVMVLAPLSAQVRGKSP